MFKVEGTFIKNYKDGRVFDVQGGLDGENKNIIVHQAHGKVN
jgi:hypothetical protein